MIQRKQLRIEGRKPVRVGMFISGWCGQEGIVCAMLLLQAIRFFHPYSLRTRAGSGSRHWRSGLITLPKSVEEYLRVPNHWYCPVRFQDRISNEQDKCRGAEASLKARVVQFAS
jgi:hypothetical protein